jgi:hypothetical protein
MEVCVMELLREIWLFIICVIYKWQAYMTGGIVMAIWTAYQWLTKKSISYRIAWAAISIFLLVGCFMAWRDQYHGALIATQETQTVQKKLDELSQPKFDLFWAPPVIGEGLESERGHRYHFCDLYLQVSVLNNGAPSVIRDCKGFLRLKDGTQLEGLLWEPAEMQLKAITTRGPRSLPTGPLLLKIWGITPIPTGGRGVGYVLFRFPSGTAERFMGPGGDIILKLWDRAGKEYKLENPWSPTSTPEYVMTLPGMNEAR